MASAGVYDVSTGWTISDVISTEYWKGIVNQELGFYDYSTNDGHPRCAYKHYRQGQFENCVIEYGCIGTTFPANTLRSYYNGTWAWGCCSWPSGWSRFIVWGGKASQQTPAK